MAEICKTYDKDFTCPACGMPGEKIKRRRMNTAYQDEESNYMTSCQLCFEESEKQWEDLWRTFGR